MNRFEMFDAMLNRKIVTLMDVQGIARKGYINGMDMEDGSGHSFMVDMYIPSNGGHHITLYIKG